MDNKLFSIVYMYCTVVSPYLHVPTYLLPLLSLSLSPSQLSTFRGTFESIVSKSVGSEAVNRKAMMKEMKASLLAKVRE